MPTIQEPVAAAREALRRNPADAWAAHALAHVFEMTARPREKTVLGAPFILIPSNME